MRKILALLPFALFAACGNVDIHLSEDAGAGEAGSGGAASSSTSGSGTSSGSSGSCACGDADGTRLKAKWITGEDGSRMHSSGWFDTEANDDCWFQYLTNGETRCTPGASTINTYEDSACVVPVFGATVCAPNPKYAKTETKVPFAPGTCGQQVLDIEYFKVDYGLPVDLQSWYTIDASGACVASQVPLNTKVWKTSPFANYTWFVKATEGVGF